jgi:hypothetical protein
LSSSTQWSERGSLSLSAAWSRTERDLTVQSRVCPLPISYCNGGLAQFITVPQTLRVSSNDLQYSASLAQRWDEASSVNLSASRALSPGGFGVALEETLNLNWTRAFSERSAGTVSWVDSRSRYDGPASRVSRAASRLRSLGLSWTTALSPDLNLTAAFQQRAYEEPGVRSRGVSKQFSIALQYQGPRLWDKP